MQLVWLNDEAIMIKKKNKKKQTHYILSKLAVCDCGTLWTYRLMVLRLPYLARGMQQL